MVMALYLMLLNVMLLHESTAARTCEMRWDEMRHPVSVCMCVCVVEIGRT